MGTEELKDDELKLKEQPDGSVVIGEGMPDEGGAADDAGGAADEGDVRQRGTDDTADDEQGAADESAESAEARHARNRVRRAQNKENRRNYVESLKRELASRDAVINDLSTRIASVEQQAVGGQMAQIDTAMKEAERYYVHFKDINKKAIELADGAAAVDAQEKMIAAQNRYNMLANAKKNMTQRTNQPPPLDPRLKAHAEKFLQEHDWYDATGADLDSDMVTKLDARLAQEGWNPTTEEYWKELRARVERFIPHKAKKGYNERQAEPSNRPRVPVSGSGDETNSGSKGTYKLSPARVQALKDAGLYDDPKQLAEAVKRYQQYDKEHQS